MSIIFDEITSMNNLERAYKQAMKGKNKFNKEAMVYSQNETHNLNKLQASLINGTYEFGSYNKFYVHEPKVRLIHAPQHQDKIIQHAINNVIKHIYQRCFIYDSYACIDYKGTHKAVDRVSEFMRRGAWEFGPGAFIIKLDIKKYFYTINRSILKNILAKRIKCKQTLNLLYGIINSANQIDSVGLPLGNLLSQLFANIYMNEFDQFCKRKLGIKYFVRYADDVIAIAGSKSESLRILELMKDFFTNELALETHDRKTKVFPISQGVNAYGFKIHKTHRLLRNDSKKKIKRKAKRMIVSIKENRMSVEKCEQILNSWHGHAMHGSSRNFINSLIERNDCVYLDYRQRLRVDTNKIYEEVI